MYPNYVLLITLMCFCISVSSLAWFMSNQETSFVTIGQRVLANPLKYENLSLISCWYMLSVWVCVNCIAIAIWSIQGTQILPIWPIWPIPLVFQRIYKRYRSYGSNGPDSHSYTVHTNAINNINCTIVLFEWKFIQIAHGPTYTSSSWPNHIDEEPLFVFLVLYEVYHKFMKTCPIFPLSENSHLDVD